MRGSWVGALCSWYHCPLESAEAGPPSFEVEEKNSHPQGINIWKSYRPVRQMDPRIWTGRTDHWSTESATVSEEDDKEVLPTMKKSRKVEDTVAGKEVSGMEPERGLMMCEVEEQQAARVEAQAQKRSDVIRVESEEMQDRVMERRSCGYPGQEEVEEIGFVPSAVSGPLWVLHLCDNECSEQGFKYIQLAAIVSEEGGAVRTINLRKQCYNERRVQQGEQPVKAAQWTEMMEQKTHRGKQWL